MIAEFKNKPETADGVPFEIGMKLYLWHDGGVMEKATDGCIIDSFHVGADEFHCVGVNGGGTDLKHFYSTPKAVIAAKITDLEAQRRGIDREIEYFRSLTEANDGQ